VNTGHLERLLDRQLREDAREPAGNHGLPRARRAREQKVVPARRRQLERAPCALLAPHVREVRTPRSVPPFRRNDGARLEGAAQIGARLGEVLNRNRLDPGESSLRADSRTDEPVEPRRAASAATSAPGTGRTRPSRASPRGRRAERAAQRGSGARAASTASAMEGRNPTPPSSAPPRELTVSRRSGH
jgi:hypothetical protein